MGRLSKSEKIVISGLTFFTAILLFAVFRDDGVLTVYEFSRELRLLEQENARLKNENMKIREEVQALKSDPAAIEKIAREKLNLARPGETIYQIVRETTKEAAPLPQPSSSSSLTSVFGL
jgi:cell division protein FtsB